MQWKSIEQRGSLLYDTTTKEILGVLWQSIDQEEVKQEFHDGHSVRFLASRTLDMHLFVVFGGGDTAWVACAPGNCPLQPLQVALQKRHSPWARRTLDADVIGGDSIYLHCDEIIPVATGRKNKPTGYNGLNIHQYFVYQFISGLLQLFITNWVL
jgi:hypothetical protein